MTSITRLRWAMAMSDPMDVDRQWWHDLGVSEGIDHLRDPAVEEMRALLAADDKCPNCGGNNFAWWGGQSPPECLGCGAFLYPDEMADTSGGGDGDE